MHYPIRTFASASAGLLGLVLLACAPTETAEDASSMQENASSQESSAQESSGCWLQRGTMAEAAERPSPRDSAVVSLGDAEVKICYGAPSARGRQVMGGLVPYDAPWRAGADEATSLHVPFRADVAGVVVDPGVYSLYTVPGNESWEIALNGTVERWGIPITPAVVEADIGRGTAAAEPMDEMVERLQYRFEPTGEGAADLLLEWERTRVRIPIRQVEG
jgi:hypothetical protein